MVDKDYNKKQHQSPTRKSYKHIWTSKKADVSVLQKMRAANLNQSFKTLISSHWKELISSHHRRRTAHGDGGGGSCDLIISDGRRGYASVWVLCQMNNAIGRGISVVPSVWAGQGRSCVTHGCCVLCSQKWEKRNCDVHVQWAAERIKHMLMKLYSRTQRRNFALKTLNHLVKLL